VTYTEGIKNMSIDKNFIVTECGLDEIEEVMQIRLNDFAKANFDFYKEPFTDIEIKAEYSEYSDENMRCFKDELRCELCLSVIFHEYTYENKAYGEQAESIGIILEYKGIQPFYINGKFDSMNVFEWIQGMPIQKHDKIYGIDKNELYKEFNVCMLDC